MEVPSFLVDHDKMTRGVYVSRQDVVGGEILTTFDVRMKVPNVEPVLGNAEIHTMEHLMAVYIRGAQSGWADRLIYVGPMGCRTGMYVIVKGDLTPQDILPLLKDVFAHMAAYDKPIPATTSKECGSYLDHNLAFARWEAEKYLKEVLAVITPEMMVYPQ